MQVSSGLKCAGDLLYKEVHHDKTLFGYTMLQ